MGSPAICGLVGPLPDLLDDPIFLTAEAVQNLHDV
jgi:hypothetical protein